MTVPSRPQHVDSPGSAEDRLLEALRSGSESAYATLVGRYHRPMLAVAGIHIRSEAVAEEVVQDTWLAVLSGLDRFEGRSSLRTYIFRILTNQAKSRARREARTVPLSTLVEREAVGDGSPAVAAASFSDDASSWPGHWVSDPRRFAAGALDQVLEAETRSVLFRAMEALPPAQRAAITLRDVYGWPAVEVCQVLGVSAGNQRVLLHRARSRVRAVLAEYLDGN